MARRRRVVHTLPPFDASTSNVERLRDRLAEVGGRLETVLGELTQLRGQCRLYHAQLTRAALTPETLFPHLL